MTTVYKLRSYRCRFWITIINVLSRIQDILTLKCQLAIEVTYRNLNSSVMFESRIEPDCAQTYQELGNLEPNECTVFSLSIHTVCLAFITQNYGHIPALNIEFDLWFTRLIWQGFVLT